MQANEIGYLTKQLLIEFNRASIRENRNRYIREDFLEFLPEGYYQVIFCMYHRKHEVRAEIILDDDGEFTYLDMSSERFESIPVYMKDSNGNYSVLSEAEIRKRLPYGGKEYTEKVSKKPYRKPSFRHDILTIYKNQCAVCGNNNIDLLRAAHIKDAASGGIE